MSKIPKHIKDIYIVALKMGAPLRKMLYNGIENKYNYGRMRAANFINYYIISEKLDKQ